MSTESRYLNRPEKTLSIDQLFSRAAALIKPLERAGLGTPQDFELATVRSLLESLPYTTGEFALACRRLDNAVYYHDRGELGAAKYELIQLRRSLVWEINHG